jgi:hypothetical protein
MSKTAARHRGRGTIPPPSAPGAHVLRMRFDGNTVGGDDLHVKIEAAFVPFPVRVGRVVRAECYVACTAARFELRTDDGTFVSWLKGEPLSAKYSVAEDDEESRSIGVSTRHGAVKMRTATKTTRSTDAEFDGTEMTLVDTLISAGHLRWSLTLHRGAKAVRDFLEGNLILWGVCRRQSLKKLKVRGTASLSDLRFFGPDRRPLSLLKSIALLIKLKRCGVGLPVDPIVREMSL